MRPIALIAMLSWIALSPAPAAEPVSRPSQKTAPSPAAVRAFVDQVTVDTEGQVPRFHEPVCVISRGLPPALGAVIEQRIHEVAEAADIPIDRRRGCLANLIVLVANEGEAVAEMLRGERPDIFRGLAPSAINRVSEGSEPVRVWRRSEVRRAEGAPIEDGRDEALRRDAHLLHGVPTSLLRETTRRDLRLSVVLFEVDSLDGLTLMQIADHAAMRGLAPTRVPSISRAQSILALFTNTVEQPAAAATRLDIAYLQALYRTTGFARESAERGNLARGMERRLSMLGDITD